MAYGVGNPNAQSINPPVNNWYDFIYGQDVGSNAISLNPSPDYFINSTLSPARTIVRTKVYSNFNPSLDAPSNYPPGALAPQIYRYTVYKGASNSVSNFTASSLGLNNGQIVQTGLVNTPLDIGDVGTAYRIVDNNLIHVSPIETDLIGVGSFSTHHHTFVINIHPQLATKVYKFKIFLEHT